MQNAPKQSFIRRRGVLILVIAVLVIGGGWALSMLSGSKSTGIKKQEFTMVQVALPPPPPPPPPPPRPDPQPREETPSTMNEVMEPDPVAADQPDAPSDEPASDGNESMGTNVQGDGAADGFGLVGRGTGSTIGGGGRGLGGGGRGNRGWDAYSGQAGTHIRNALSQNEKTRASSIRIVVSIWPNADGIIERARLDTSTGNAELDHAIETEVLVGTRLSSPPPADMPLPIRIRITGQRP